ncbi:biotin-independent malonate decarboxylase subunit gamma [Klebsiella pneumoniae]|nr:biotin-independent malonate decarboxylase subunit gamma [Klebsiella pneumoniae]
MSQFPNRAALWLNKLAPDAPLMSGLCPSVQVADGQINGENVRFIAVVPDANNHYPRAAGGEVGLLEGCQALAGAAGAYAKARLAGHPVIGLIVGKAMSGAFLAHGYQANRLIAFNDSGVLVHAMGKASAARITLRTVEALEKLAATIPPMAYDVSNYATLGLLSALLDINNPDAPDDHDLSLVSNTLRDAIADARTDASLKCRLGAENRRSSQLVRDRMRASW